MSAHSDSEEELLPSAPVERVSEPSEDGQSPVAVPSTVVVPSKAAVASRATRRKRGRKINPHSKRQMEMQQVNKRRELRRIRTLNIDNCDPAKSRCQCEDCHGYTAYDVCTVRDYLDSLVQLNRKGSKRAFVEERITLKNGYREFWMDPPTVLRRKATQARVSGADWERPGDPYINGDDLQSVCETWFRFILCISGDYYQQPGQGSSKSMLVDTDRSYAPRIPKKEQAILKWIKTQAQLSCIMPDSEMVVLSYNTKSAAHAAYVVEFEESLGCPWADEAKQAYYGRMGEVQDEADCLELEQAGVSSASERILLGGQPRYGNYLLGETGSLPENDKL